jgi:hypothetical protein
MRKAIAARSFERFVSETKAGWEDGERTQT